MTERETEIKLLLSQSGAEKLSSILGEPIREKTLVNQYFVAQAAVERRDWVLRLRSEGDKRTLTLKIGREVAPGLFDSIEVSEQVTETEPVHWESTSTLRRFREEISNAPIRLLGETKTLRRVCRAPLAGARFWEIDQTLYPDGTLFWELEIEICSDQGQPSDGSSLPEMIREWLVQHGIENSPSRKTKYARFLDSLKEAS